MMVSMHAKAVFVYAVLMVLYSIAQWYKYRVCKRSIIAHILLKDSSLCTSLDRFTDLVEGLFVSGKHT